LTAAAVFFTCASVRDQNRPISPHQQCGASSGARATLVSVAIGPQYEAKFPTLNAAASAGGFDAVQLWTESDMMNDPIFREHSSAFRTLHRTVSGYEGGLNHYFPYCGAFKPLALLRALLNSCEGDYAMWTDASRYFAPTLDGANVKRAISQLKTEYDPPPIPPGSSWASMDMGALRTKADSIYGQMTCRMHDMPESAHYKALVQKTGVLADGVIDLPNPHEHLRLCEPGHISSSPTAFLDAFDVRRADLMQNYNILRNMLIANTPDNRALLWEWLNMALDQPVPFCAPANPEEAALQTLLVKKSLPVFSTCMYITDRVYLNDHTSPKYFLDAVSSSKFAFLPPRTNCTLGSKVPHTAALFTAVDEDVCKWQLRTNLTSSCS